MSIQAYRFWEPTLELRPFRGFPESVGKTIRDRVTSYKLTDDKRFLDKIEIELDNGDGALLTLEAFPAGITFKSFFGYPGLMSPPRLMQCRKIKGAGRVGGLGKLSGPNIAAGGILKMELKSQVWSMNFTRALSTIDKTQERSLILEKTTIPDAARAIARKYGYDGPSLFVEDGTDEPVIEKASIPTRFSLAEWLINEARNRKWIFRINSDGFHFHSDDFEPQFKQTYAEDLSWFNGDPDVIRWEITNDLNVPQDVEVKVSDARAEAAFSQLSAVRANGKETTVTALLKFKNGAKGAGLSPNLMLASSSKKRAFERASQAINNAAKRWKLKMRLVGNPKVCVGRNLNLRNFGPLVDGEWRPTKVIHSIRPGQVYITEVEAKRRAIKGGNKKIFWFQMEAIKANGEITIVSGLGASSS